MRNFIHSSENRWSGVMGYSTKKMSFLFVFPKSALSRQLKTVDFEDCVKLTDKAAEFVSQCKELQTLSLRRCAKLTDAALAHLLKCPELQNLDLGGCRNLTDATAEHLTKCSKLETVNLEQCGPELKGSIDEGPNYSNFSYQSSVKILAKFRNFRQKNKENSKLSGN